MSRSRPLPLPYTCGKECSLQLAVITLFMAGLVLLNYRIGRSVLYPPFIFTIMWLIVFSIYQTGLIEIDSLHKDTLLPVDAGSSHVRRCYRTAGTAKTLNYT
jgi:hypothetical protein